MATKSFILKMKTKNNPQLRLSLWKTHELFNFGVAYYMDLLSLFRQKDLYMHNDEDPDHPVVLKKEEIQERLWMKVRETQQKNGFHGEVSKDEVLETLRALYEELVPSAVGKSGEANQISNKYLYPLTDPASQSGKGTANSGRKPRWKKLKEAGDPSWKDAYEKWEKERQEDPKLKILAALQSFGLIPLFRPFTENDHKAVISVKWMPKSKNQSVRKFDKDMFNQAIERFLSWESWNEKVAEDYEKTVSIYESLQKELKGISTKAFEIMERVEKAYEAHLREITFSNSTYRIGNRAIRGWTEIVKKWMKLDPSAPQGNYLDVVKDYQRRHPRESGDFKLFELLSRPENQAAWREYPEFLPLYVKYRHAEQRMKTAKKQATFTLCDPIRHPLWVRYEERSGTNLNKYRLIMNEKEKVVQFDRLICLNADGHYEEQEDVTVPLAPSQQFDDQIKFSSEDTGKGKHNFSYYHKGINYELKGTLGGARIQFDREHLLRRQGVKAGNVGRIFLNVTLNIEPMQPFSRSGNLQTSVGKALKVYVDGYPKVVNFKPKELTEHIKESEKNTLTLGVESLPTGLRVMSVDLGQRQAAAISIFEVVSEKPDDNKLFYPVKDTDLFAVHRTSFNIKLPGEKRTERRMLEQQKRDQAIRDLSRKLKFLKNVLNMQKLEKTDEREKRVNRWIKDREREEENPVYVQEFEMISKVLYSPHSVWVDQLKSIHRKLEEQLGKEISKWRQSISQGRQGVYGISLKNIEDIEKTRRLLFRWSMRPENPGEVKQLQPGERFAIDQQNHLNHLKDDRIKKLANQIVMTALGYRYDGKRKKWIAKHPACQLVLFEDLSRYAFYDERSRLENRNLMRWSRREIPKQVAQIGGLYGLLVGEVGAQYSSRFHAKSGAPGIRCRVVKEHELYITEGGQKVRNQKFLDSLVENNIIEPDDARRLEPGDLIRDQGGDKFATLDERGELVITHADINAAQNLQKRFWTRTHGLYRIRCESREIKDAVVLVPSDKDQKEKMENLFGIGYLQPFKQENDVYKWVKGEKIKGKKTSSQSDDKELVSEILQEASVMADELKGNRKTLFRDPSGYVFPKDRWYTGGRYFGTLEHLLKRKLAERRLFDGGSSRRGLFNGTDSNTNVE
ncbi:type V CRISPR-associated protein Cas12b [Tuberibacillus calidus]|uniref:type V CRISPR-associated protein Cas12b n=1 Tax=Tuberibacillus calidus TaxID=340097 RepID=UPI00041D2C8B|nr:type V CRISPR-associated protein Cas12b [Tuberibacillus calidus]